MQAGAQGRGGVSGAILAQVRGGGVVLGVCQRDTVLHISEVREQVGVACA